MKASELFVKALENEGVDRIFAIPGKENLDVAESLRTSSIELGWCDTSSRPPSWPPRMAA